MNWKNIPCGPFWLIVPDVIGYPMSAEDFDRIIETLHLFKRWIVKKEDVWTDGTWLP